MSVNRLKFFFILIKIVIDDIFLLEIYTQLTCFNTFIITQIFEQIKLNLKYFKFFFF